MSVQNNYHFADFAFFAFSQNCLIWLKYHWILFFTKTSTRENWFKMLSVKWQPVCLGPNELSLKRNKFFVCDLTCSGMICLIVRVRAFCDYLVILMRRNLNNTVYFVFSHLHNHGYIHFVFQLICELPFLYVEWLVPTETLGPIEVNSTQCTQISNKPLVMPVCDTT